MALASRLPGLTGLRAITTGSPDVTVALIDGPVLLDAPQFATARLTVAPGHENRPAPAGAATRHGTFVASLLFAAAGGGRPDGEGLGLCPGCAGLVAPILGETEEGGLVPADQFGLARALEICVEAGADIINVSAGQKVAAPEADAVLARALEHCAERGVLVVAAAGNGGCACAELPAALPWAVAVGSHGEDGRPSPFSNFGAHYAGNGLLAPGEAIVGRDAAGQEASADGTSYAAAVVTGTAALLLSAVRARGLAIGADELRRALIETAAPCGGDPTEACLAGRLDIAAAMRRLGLQDQRSGSGTGRTSAMSDGLADVQDVLDMPAIMPLGADGVAPAAMRRPDPAPAGIWPSDCGCGGKCGCGGHGGGQCSCGKHGNAAGQPQLVYALGTLDVDFGSEARRDAFIQAMPDETSPYNPQQLAAFLADNPTYEQGLTWILRLDASPIYAIRPAGTYGRDTADRLREIFVRQFDQDIEIVSVPGYMTGSVRLLSGVTVPVIYPDVRGIYAWDVPTLAKSMEGRQDTGNPAASLENFLNRVYYEFRNLGVTPQERALNYSATNAFQVSQVFGQALGNNMVLDGIKVEKSPICRPESDCWDVVLTFFQPNDVLRTARMSYRFSVDVSDILPVLVGPVRSWAVY